MIEVARLEVACVDLVAPGVAQRKRLSGACYLTVSRSGEQRVAVDEAAKVRVARDGPAQARILEPGPVARCSRRQETRDFDGEHRALTECHVVNQRILGVRRQIEAIAHADRELGCRLLRDRHLDERSVVLLPPERKRHTGCTGPGKAPSRVVLRSLDELQRQEPGRSRWPGPTRWVDDRVANRLHKSAPTLQNSLQRLREALL